MVSYGLLECNSSGQGSTLLPLQSTNVSGKIVGLCAEIHIQQRYFNHRTTAVECMYRFPLDENSTVVGMEVEVGGVRIIGQVKEKEEARREYEQAKAQRHTGVLVEENQSNDFTCMIGTFPPSASCNVTLIYITTLQQEGAKHRFVLPAVVAPKYTPSVPVGAVSTYATTSLSSSSDERRSFSLIDEATTASTTTVALTPSASNVGSMPAPNQAPNMPQVGIDGAAASRTTLFVNVDVVMPTALKYVGSASHALRVTNVDQYRSNVQLGRSATSTEGEAVAHLERDVVVMIEEAGGELVAPRAMLEYNQANNSFAMQLAFNPPEVDLLASSQLPCELIFLLDRSGSMSGSSISAVRDAMKVLLHSLPTTCKFNIVGFGSSFTSLFPSSPLYNNESLQTAIAHVTTLEADLGGTEILAPLEYLHRTMPVDRRYPRQLFLLTDGEVDNVDACVSYTRKMASDLRMFTFGIGDNVDRNLVKKLAASCQGGCEFITSREVGSEAFDAKIMTQLQRALQPSVNNLKIDWSPFTNGANKGGVMQTPSKLLPMFAQSRAIVYGMNLQLPAAWQEALSSSSASTSSLPPLTLLVEGDCNHPGVDASSGYRHAITVSVDRVSRGGFVHRLAARERIKELEHEIVLNASASAANKPAILQLALQYQLSSRFTSFIAVNTQTVVPHTSPLNVHAPGGAVDIDEGSAYPEEKCKVSSSSSSNMLGLAAKLCKKKSSSGGLLSSVKSFFSRSPRSSVSSSSAPSAPAPAASVRSATLSPPSPPQMKQKKEDMCARNMDEEEEDAAMDDLFGESCEAECDQRELSKCAALKDCSPPPPPPAPVSLAAPSRRAAAPAPASSSSFSSAGRAGPSSSLSAGPSVSYSALVHHQQADGWFNLNDALLASLNSVLTSKSLKALSMSTLSSFCKSAGVSESALATMLVLLLLDRFYSASKAMWALSASKAKFALKTHASIDADNNTYNVASLLN